MMVENKYCVVEFWVSKIVTVIEKSELAIEEETIEGSILDSNDCSLESPVDAKKKHVCEYCSKEFPFRSYLVQHIKTHTGERPFLCSTCGKGFQQSGQLVYHIRTHTGFRPHVCTICKAGFTNKSKVSRIAWLFGITPGFVACSGVLRVHIRRHVNERPYVCASCGMAFHQSTDLRAHTKTHTGGKRRMCLICGKLMSTTGKRMYLKLPCKVSRILCFKVSLMCIFVRILGRSHMHAAGVTKGSLLEVS